ncbi:MAG: insulinase family protein [Gemmatimonadetes bacterium]|nr:insulinase family protein [Gemmatimonadota bacterium]
MQAVPTLHATLLRRPAPPVAALVVDVVSAAARRAWPVAALVPGLLAATVLPASAQAPSGMDLPVHEVVLDNGMRFLVLPRPGAPTVSFVTQYAVGGVNEELGTTGLAHLLEHLLFKGTTTVGTRDLRSERRLFRIMDALQDSILVERARQESDTLRVERLRERIRELEDQARRVTVSNEMDRILSRNGAQSLNATTTSESTIYYVELPSNRAELWFVLEADRMLNPVFREFYSERDVVLEERLMRVETSPSGLLYEEHMAAAYRLHPYGVPVIGWMSDIRNHTRAEVMDYYRRFYGPNNAVVAIVGDVDPEEVEEWARAYFDRIPPGETPPPVLAAEPPQRGERRVEVVHDAEAALRVGWHTVDTFHPDSPALVMLSSLLTGGRTSRLYRRLVTEERLATFVSSSLGPGDRFPRLFSLDAYPRAPHGAAEVERAIYEELERIRETPPRMDELQRVRNQIEAGGVRRLQSNLGLAFQLAESETLYGDWRTTFRLSERIDAVTPEDVSRVARTYLTPTNRTVAVLVKPGGDAHAVIGGPADTARTPGGGS